MEVALVRWPDEAEVRQRLAADGQPRLLLVEGDALPPLVDDAMEDWIRIPAAEADVRARVEAVVRRCRLTDEAPTLDEDGVIRHQGAWTSLPPVEARLTRLLLDRFGAVVSREALSRAGWPEGAPGRNALDVHVLRLRRRLVPVGLVIRTVRSRGYLLEGASSRSASRSLAREA